MLNVELKRVLSGKHPSITFDLVKKISTRSVHFSTEANFTLLVAHGEMESRKRRLKYLCFIFLETAYQYFIAPATVVMKIAVDFYFKKPSKSQADRGKNFKALPRCRS